SSLIEKEKFWAEKVHSKRKYQVVFSGDSRLYRGIDPKTVSETLGGLSVLNFGFSSGGHNNAIFDEINNRLDQKSSLKAVVLVLSPYSLTPKAQQNEHYNQEKNRDRKEVFNRRYVKPFFSFLDPIKPSEIIHLKSGQIGYYERFQKDGWVASWKIPSDSKTALKGYVKDFEDNTVQNDILVGVFDQITKWRAMGVQVFAFRIPSTAEMEDLEHELSGYKEAVIRDGVEQAGGKWIDFENRFEYESYDGSHLTKVSALKLSAQIGNELKKRLKGV
ncbi:MAG: hypothetical protein ACFCUL_01765, partial [Flavobacteriaceae bacterium]